MQQAPHEENFLFSHRHLEFHVFDGKWFNIQVDKQQTKQKTKPTSVNDMIAGLLDQAIELFGQVADVDATGTVFAFNRSICGTDVRSGNRELRSGQLMHQWAGRGVVNGGEDVLNGFFERWPSREELVAECCEWNRQDCDWFSRCVGNTRMGPYIEKMMQIDCLMSSGGAGCDRGCSADTCFGILEAISQILTTGLKIYETSSNDHRERIRGLCPRKSRYT